MNYRAKIISRVIEKIWQSACPSGVTLDEGRTGKILETILAYREGSNHVVGN
jgi:hypothetical protein